MARNPAASIPSRDHRPRLGAAGERIAACWLWLRGYRLLARRLRTPAAEIDFLARHGATLVVIEVKSRRRGTAPRFVRRISPAQERRLARAAIWVHARYGGGGGVRIDLVTVEFPRGRLWLPKVRILRAAVGEDVLSALRVS